MLSSTPEYFCFLILVFFAYWLAPLVPRGPSRIAGLVIVCLANLFFLAKWGLIYLLLVPLASTSDFFIGRALARSQSPRLRRLLLALSLVVNVGLIISCKYVPLFSQTWASWSSHPAPPFLASWVLPLGLSFYAFQSLTYTLDIYRRDTKPTTDYLAHLASTCFFSTVLAGPITRIAALLPQWAKADRALTPEEGSRAIFLIGLGLFKKFLIADYLASNLINRVFDLPTLYSGGDVLVAVYAYAFQLYYDFSAYSDIAIGSALLLGIRLPINFNFPYKADSIADFWRRWHITFSHWLRDYLYFSLPGQRSKIWPYFNLIITMAIGGFWHGASWTFLIWGLIHGAGLAGFRLWQALRGNRKPSNWWPARVGCTALTFHYVLFAWIFFRAGSLDTASQVLAQIGSFHYSFENTSGPFLMVLAIAVAAHFTPRNWYDSSVSLFARAPALVQGVALVLLSIAIQYVATTGAAPFIYTKF
jgi:D-alanyl-lipoteichoic acid acyltransferase DltB (MBOAT superfamily)